jgi:hypothetical protein
MKAAMSHTAPRAYRRQPCGCDIRKARAYAVPTVRAMSSPVISNEISPMLSAIDLPAFAVVNVAPTLVHRPASS